MADTVEITPGSGAVIGTDEVSIGGTLQQVQRVKLVDGTDGGTDLLGGSTARGLRVDPRPKTTRIAVTPTISTAVYAAKDAVGGLMEFANAVRDSGGSGVLQTVVVVDRDQERASMDLVLFRTSITAPTDNAAFDPTDTELADCVGVIPIYTADYSDFNDNAVASRYAGLPFTCSGTSLYGVLVARAAPTYTATNDLIVTLQINQD